MFTMEITRLIERCRQGDADALRIYFNLCIIKYFLNIISPNNDMKAKVDALLAAYPSIDVTAMGFPRGWESEPLWQ